MEIKYIETEGKPLVAELSDKNFIISNPQHVLDVFGELMGRDCSRLLIPEANLHPDFFDLKTRFAGEVLQKFSNYRVKVAILGDFAKFKSKSLHDFILESNKSNHVLFTPQYDTAILMLQK